MKTVGIDVCPSGWFAVSLSGDENNYWIIYNKEEMKACFEEYDRIFIDIPVGIETDQYVRKADEELRETLGPDYRASVFNPPIRPALYAPTYAEASMQSYEITGKKVSIQSWNITMKIRMVDELLREHPEFREKVCESHPELLYKMMSSGASLLQKKATKEGLRHRRHLIKAYHEPLDDLYREVKEEYRRNEVKKDDILDALALAIFAKESEENGLMTIPEDPEMDEEGIKMAIHYTQFELTKS